MSILLDSQNRYMYDREQFLSVPAREHSEHFVTRACDDCANSACISMNSMFMHMVLMFCHNTIDPNISGQKLISLSHWPGGTTPAPVLRQLTYNITQASRLAGYMYDATGKTLNSAYSLVAQTYMYVYISNYRTGLSYHSQYIYFTHLSSHIHKHKKISKWDHYGSRFYRFINNKAT